jgi:WD40 repeat protein
MMIGGSSGAVIEAGDAGNSYLWNLVTHASEPKMPPNSEKLPAEQLAIIQKWIDMGALENSGSTASIKKKPSLAKIEISNQRPADVAMPQQYFGDPLFSPSHTNAVTALACSPWAPLVAISGYRQIGMYQSQSLELLGVLSYPEGQPQIIKFSRNGSLVLVGGGRGGLSGRVVVYDVKTGQRKIEIGDEYDEILAADISPDQSLIALGGPKRMLRIYSTATGEMISESKKHTDRSSMTCKVIRGASPT